MRLFTARFVSCFAVVVFFVVLVAAIGSFLMGRIGLGLLLIMSSVAIVYVREYMWKEFDEGRL